MSEFKTYRAVTKIHLGQIERDLYEGDVVEYNGQTLKIGEESFQLSSLRAAITKNWLVDSSDVSSKYVPQSANIGVRKATQAGEEADKKIAITTVNDEEKVVGSASPSNLKVAEDSSNEDAVQIGKVKTASKQKSVLKDGASVDAEINRLDNMSLKASVVRREDQQVAKSLNVSEAQQALAEAEPVAEPTATNTELDEVRGEVSALKGQLESMMLMMSKMIEGQQSLLNPPAPSEPSAPIQKKASASVQVDDSDEYSDLMPDAEILGSNVLKSLDDDDESLDLSLSDDFNLFDTPDEDEIDFDESYDDEYEGELAFVDEDMEPVDLKDVAVEDSETEESVSEGDEADESIAEGEDSIPEHMVELSDGSFWDMSRHYQTRASDLINNYLKSPLLPEILEVEVHGVRKRVESALSSAS